MLLAPLSAAEKPATASQPGIIAILADADFQRSFQAKIEKQPEVDGSRIGASGHSMAGKLTTKLAGIDKRVKVASQTHSDLFPSQSSTRDTESGDYSRIKIQNVVTICTVGYRAVRSFSYHVSAPRISDFAYLNGHRHNRKQPIFPSLKQSSLRRDRRRFSYLIWTNADGRPGSLRTIEARCSVIERWLDVFPCYSVTI